MKGVEVKSGKRITHLGKVQRHQRPLCLLHPTSACCRLLTPSGETQSVTSPSAHYEHTLNGFLDEEREKKERKKKKKKEKKMKKEKKKKKKKEKKEEEKIWWREKRIM